MEFEIFYNLLTVPRTISNTYAQVLRAQSCANHMQHERSSAATCRVTCQVVWRDSSAIKYDRDEIAFILAQYNYNNFTHQKWERSLDYMLSTFQLSSHTHTHTHTKDSLTFFFFLLSNDV